MGTKQSNLTQSLYLDDLQPLDPFHALVHKRAVARLSPRVVSSRVIGSEKSATFRNHAYTALHKP